MCNNQWIIDSWMCNNQSHERPIISFLLAFVSVLLSGSWQVVGIQMEDLPTTPKQGPCHTPSQLGFQRQPGSQRQVGQPGRWPIRSGTRGLAFCTAILGSCSTPQNSSPIGSPVCLCSEHHLGYRERYTQKALSQALHLTGQAMGSLTPTERLIECAQGSSVWDSCHLKRHFFFFFFFSLSAPTAYASSQARGLIGAIAAGLTTSTATWDLSRVCDLHHNSWQHRIRDPSSEARDRTHHLMVRSRIHFRCITRGTP